jgi:hypothetical protein
MALLGCCYSEMNYLSSSVKQGFESIHMEDVVSAYLPASEKASSGSLFFLKMGNQASKQLLKRSIFGLALRELRQPQKVNERMGLWGFGSTLDYACSMVFWQVASPELGQGLVVPCIPQAFVD